MNKKITRFAFGAKCGRRGANGSFARASLPNNPANANAPNPAPDRESISRRVTGCGPKSKQLWLRDIIP